MSERTVIQLARKRYGARVFTETRPLALTSAEKSAVREQLMQLIKNAGSSTTLTGQLLAAIETVDGLPSKCSVRVEGEYGGSTQLAAGDTWGEVAAKLQGQSEAVPVV